MKKRISAISLTLILILNSCAILSSTSKPIGITGSFKIKMRTGARYFKETKQYPVSGNLVEDVPFLNGTFIPAGSGLLGIYKNGGFSCTIVWTTIVPPNNPPLSNAAGVAISNCSTRQIIYESDIITAKWN